MKAINNPLSSVGSNRWLN